MCYRSKKQGNQIKRDKEPTPLQISMRDLDEFSYDEQYYKLMESCPDVVASMAGLMMPRQNFDSLEVVVRI